MAGFVMRAAALVLPLALAALPGWASERVALVIGNATYAHASRLANPLNDAGDIGAALERLGFAVARLADADQTAMRRALQDFAKAASTAKIAVVFYAGHGIEIDRRNFLVPVDARLASDRDIEFEAVPLDLAMRAVEQASELRLIVLDACRDNPFAAAMKRSGATRSIGRGLARVEPSGETLVAYAAKGGSVAADGRGRNSPYSTALLAHLEEPGLEVGLMFRKVRDTVLAATGGKQEPFVYGSLSSKGAYLLDAPESAPAVATAARPPVATNGSARLTAEQLAAERLFWETVKDSADPADLEAYRRRYPGGTFAALAANRLERLKRKAGAPASQTVAALAPGAASRLSPEAVEAALELERSERRAIQAGLASLGFDPGPADGLFGRKTRAAVSAWQSANGEAATGWLTQAEASALKEAGTEVLRARAKAEAERKARAEAERKERARRAIQPGRAFRDCGDCPEMVVVPAGSFVMGSPASEVLREDSEGPQRRVTISRPFAVGKYEVTREEFARFVSATGRSMGDFCSIWENGEIERRYGHGWRNSGYRQTGRDPVVCVNWEDARAYVSWLSQETGKRYRLLSEAEWEYAARAGTRSSRWWGDGEAGQCRHANGADRALARRYPVSRLVVAECDDGHVHTSPVGSFSANGFGLHDMFGNVWEWVEDCWHDSYAGAPPDGSAWTTEDDCSVNVLRGGSWRNHAWGLRSARRYRESYSLYNHSRYSYFGFRVARTLAP